MLERWKLRRELDRIKQQLSMIPEVLYEPILRRKHDRAFEKGFTEHKGAVELTSKVAIFIVWQPDGLLASTLDTCRHLHAAGYSVMLISNAKLRPDDITAVKPCAWRIIDRPNFGYDFGGYRDGIRLLDREGIVPDDLIILNDSIYFPIFPNDDTIKKLEQSDADISGMILRRRGDASFLESYFYLIKGHVLHHEAFRDFWNKYPLTSNKYKTIRRGERGFGAAMESAGLKIDGLFTEQDFRAEVLAADHMILREIVKHAALPSREATQTARSLAQNGTTEQLQIFIFSQMLKLQFYSAFPVASHSLMKFSVLKRSNDEVASAWRREYLRAVDAGLIAPPTPSVADELRRHLLR